MAETIIITSQTQLLELDDPTQTQPLTTSKLIRSVSLKQRKTAKSQPTPPALPCKPMP